MALLNEIFENVIYKSNFQDAALLQRVPIAGKVRINLWKRENKKES